MGLGKSRSVSFGLCLAVSLCSSPLLADSAKGQDPCVDAIEPLLRQLDKAEDSLAASDVATAAALAAIIAAGVDASDPSKTDPPKKTTLPPPRSPVSPVPPATVVARVDPTLPTAPVVQPPPTAPSIPTPVRTPPTTRPNPVDQVQVGLKDRTPPPSNDTIAGATDPRVVNQGQSSDTIRSGVAASSLAAKASTQNQASMQGRFTSESLATSPSALRSPASAADNDVMRHAAGAGSVGRDALTANHQPMFTGQAVSARSLTREAAEVAREDGPNIFRINSLAYQKFTSRGKP